MARMMAIHTPQTTPLLFCQNKRSLSSNVTAVVASTATRLRSSPAGRELEGVAGVVMQAGWKVRTADKNKPAAVCPCRKQAISKELSPCRADDFSSARNFRPKKD